MLAVVVVVVVVEVVVVVVVVVDVLHKSNVDDSTFIAIISFFPSLNVVCSSFQPPEVAL